MIRTLNNKYALAVADFGRSGFHARDWTKNNKGHLKKAKKILCQTLNTDFSGELF